MLMHEVTLYYEHVGETRWHVLGENASAAAAKARDLAQRKHGLDDRTHQRGAAWTVYTTREGRLLPPELSHRRRWQLQG